MEMGGQLQAAPALPPFLIRRGKTSGTRWFGAWAWLRTDLVSVEKIKISFFSRELNSDTSASQAVGLCYTN
jgi:hypothetical protein